MGIEEQGVKPEEQESPTAQQEGVNEIPADTQQEGNANIPEQGQTQEQPFLEGGNPQVEEVDEMGVPYKNRFMEYKRKYEELNQKVQTLEQQLSQPQTAQQRKYTIQELEAYAQANPEFRPWVEEEKAKILKEELLKATEEKVKQAEAQRAAEIKRQQALQYVINNYPDAFKKSADGKIVDWNPAHPLTKQIGILMQDPRFANDPEGLIAAADIAYARYMRQQTPKIQAQIKQVSMENKQLQKKTLVEGGSAQPQESATPVRKTIEKVRQTGSIKDASQAMKEIFKAKGVLEE
ncbi:MAG TPA: hypothetical protein ENL45_02125 [Candidatus Woesearchaeota archaeon]|nr:hypothetical protein [Candidatus Woesearchaeota archaeon]